MAKVERESGFYWIKDGGEWQIARWVSGDGPDGKGRWYLCGWEVPEKHVDEIVERRITK